MVRSRDDLVATRVGPANRLRSLLEGFWLQIAAGSVLIAGGLLLPRYLRPAPAASSAETTADRGLGRARRLLTRGGDKLERGRTGARGERPVDGEGSVSGAST